MAGSADGAISRSLAAYFLSGSDHSVTEATPSLARPTSVSGIATTASFSAKRATRIAVWPDGDDLAGLDQGRGDDAAGIGRQRRIRERVLGQFDLALGAIEPRPRLIGGGARRIHLRIGGPALGAKILGALLGSGGLRQHAGGGGKLGLRLLGLQLQIDFIQYRQRLAEIDGLADFDQTLGDLARNPEAHVGLDPGLDRADKASLGGCGFIFDGGDQNRASGNGLFRRRFLAAAQRDHRKSQQRTRQEPEVTR